MDPKRDLRVREETVTYQPSPAMQGGTAGRPAPPYPSSMLVMDARLKGDCAEIALPGRTTMERTLERWPEFGLPELTERRRLTRLLQHHSERGMSFEVQKV
jgi:hypothetical protein